MTVLVPTMGSLHRGHQALIKRARALSKEVIVSIFVNPLQFENKEDLDAFSESLSFLTNMIEFEGILKNSMFFSYFFFYLLNIL